MQGVDEACDRQQASSQKRGLHQTNCSTAQEHESAGLEEVVSELAQQLSGSNQALMGENLHRLAVETRTWR